MKTRQSYDVQLFLDGNTTMATLNFGTKKMKKITKHHDTTKFRECKIMHSCIQDDCGLYSGFDELEN